MKRLTKKPTLYFIFSYDRVSKEIDLTISVNEKLEEIERFISYIDYIMDNKSDIVDLTDILETYYTMLEDYRALKEIIVSELGLNILVIIKTSKYFKKQKRAHGHRLRKNHS